MPSQCDRKHSCPPLPVRDLARRLPGGRALAASVLRRYCEGAGRPSRAWVPNSLRRLCVNKVSRSLREVVFVDGVRTPFGKAGPRASTRETRADDLVDRCIRELMRRNPGLPAERVDEVAIAATTQIGDQGLTLGRTAALLAGLPKTVPGFAIDRMCAGAMTAVTTTASGIAFGAYDVAIAGGVEHMGRHPMGEGADPNPRFIAEKLVDPSALVMGSDRGEPARPLPAPHQGARRRLRAGQPAEVRQGVANGQIQPELVTVATRRAEQGWGLATVDEPPRPDTTLEGLATLQDAVPPARARDRRQRGQPQRRRDRLPARAEEVAARARACRPACGSSATASSAWSPR